MFTEQLIPAALRLRKTQQLEIDWKDGLKSVYSISRLRSLCPCAQCRMVRTGTNPHDLAPVEKPKTSLTILPGNYTSALAITHAEKVGNYALKFAFTDDHDSGIYTFEYLRELAEASAKKK